MAKSGRPQIEIFCQNFRILNSVLCAKRRELTRQLQSFESITDVSELFAVRSNSH